MGAFRRTAGVRIEDVLAACSIHGIPYVPRDCERDVEQRLQQRRVLIVGPAMAGKTRLALQLAQEIFPDHGFVDAQDGTALRQLLEAEPTESRLVIWLDDLGRFLGADPLTLGVLDLLHSRGNVLIATTGLASYEVLTSTGALRAFGSGVLDWFGEPVRLADWSAGELDRAVHRGVPDELLASARRSGLSACVGGGPGLLRWLRVGIDNQPVGYALVRAAADWRRAGMSPQLIRLTLVDLLPAYVNNVSAAADPDAVSNGLSWATTRVNGVALLGAHGDGLRLLDYALENLAAEVSMIPQGVWDIALARALPHELINVGYRAAICHERPDIATAAYRLAADSADPMAAPPAALYLGKLCQRHGDMVGAAAAYRQALESRHPDYAPAAALALGGTREDRFDPTGAAASYQFAMDTGHAEYAPAAALRLGNLRRNRGDLAGAAQAFRFAIDSRHPVAAAQAASRLADARREQNASDVQTAAMAAVIESVKTGVERSTPGHGYGPDADVADPAKTRRLPIASSSAVPTANAHHPVADKPVPDTVTMPAVPLLTHRRTTVDDDDGFLTAFQRSRASVAATDRILVTAKPATAPANSESALEKGKQRLEHGDLDGALAALHEVLDSGDPQRAPAAALIIGSVHRDRGEVDRAATAYRVAVDSGHPEHAADAAAKLSSVLEDRDSLEQAAAYRRDIEAGDRNDAPNAALSLAFLCQSRDDAAGEAAAYQMVIEFDNPEFLPIAAYNLGVLRQENGELDEAAAAWELAIESGDATFGPTAAFNLGILRREEEDVEAAIVAWRVAVDSGDVEYAPAAAMELGALRQELGDDSGAAADWKFALASGHPDYAPAAAIYLGLLLDEHDDLDGAAAAYQVAIDSKHETEAPEAAVRLGLLREKRGDLDGAAEAYRLAVDSDHVVYSSDAETCLENLDNGVSNIEDGSAPPDGRAEPESAVREVTPLGAVQDYESLSDLAEDDVLSRTFLRVYDQSAVGEAEGFSYARPIVGNLVELFVLDFPDTVQLLRRAELERFDRDALHEAALANLLAAPIDDYEVFSDNGATMHVVFGQSVYIASKLLILPDVLRKTVGVAEPPHGVLVCAPNLHELAFHPIADSSVLPSLQQLSQFAAQSFAEGASSVSPFVYWWQQGRLSQLTRYDTEGQLFLDVDKAFDAVLDQVVGDPHA